MIGWKVPYLQIFKAGKIDISIIAKVIAFQLTFCENITNFA